jgi:hypothetical protein
LDVQGTARFISIIGTGPGNSSFAGNVGIGTTLSANALEVATGGVSIGTAFAGNLTAPINGLAIQGNVGMGTSIAPFAMFISQSSSPFGIQINAPSSNGGDEVTAFSSSQNNSVWTLGRRNSNSSLELTYQTATTAPSVRSGSVLSVSTGGNVGIGTIFASGLSTNSQGLMVSGGVTIGNTQTAPSGGMLIQGNVGIGTGVTTPTGTLQIFGKCAGLSGDLYLNAGVLSVCTAGTFPACSSSTNC